MMVAVVVREVVVLVDGADTVLLHKVASERASELRNGWLRVDRGVFLTVIALVVWWYDRGRPAAGL